MIYLFEDRRGRMEQYIEQQLNTEVVKIALIECARIDLDSYLDQQFSDAEVVLFHSSYLFIDQSITNEDVKRHFKNKKIPFVYFSGGLKNNITIENNVTNADSNSGDMYNNLNNFIAEYVSKRKINIPLLVYGEKYLLNSLLELQTVISLYLFDRSKNYIINTEDFYEIIDLIDARIKEEEFQGDKLKLLNWLQDKIGAQKLDKETLLSQIQKLNDKY